MLSTGLPISRYVSVQVSLTTPGVVGPAINTGLIIGSSSVIDAGERMRRYANISEVADEFDTDSPEYLGADAWFSQNPRPDHVMLGRWIKTAESAQLIGADLTLAEQGIALWQDIADGSFSIAVDGASHNVSGLDFSLISNLNAVATAINTAMTTATIAASCVWNGHQFIFTTTATGAAAQIGYLTPVSPSLGTDISATLKGTVATAARVSPGSAPETALAAVAAIDSIHSSQFYGIVVPEADDAEQQDIAAYVEACDPPHYFGVTSGDTRTLDPLDQQNLASVLNNFGYNKTACQYSTSNPYAICSYLSRILTTRWTGQNTAITLMYKREPGVAVEPLSTQQADTLRDKSCNVYAGVANGAHVVQYGTSASGEYTDTIIGADALALDVQAGLFNTLYTTNTKIPQTDFGVGILLNNATAVCSRYVGNGFLAPGVWNAPGFGNISQGDVLPLGYYVWAPTIALQDPVERAARKSPLIQVAAKCAGAIHTADVLIYVNQ